MLVKLFEVSVELVVGWMSYLSSCLGTSTSRWSIGQLGGFRP